MTVSDILLILACTVGLAMKVNSMIREHRAAARKRLEDHGERRWGIRKPGLFEGSENEDEEQFWE